MKDDQTQKRVKAQCTVPTNGGHCTHKLMCKGTCCTVSNQIKDVVNWGHKLKSEWELRTHNKSTHDTLKMSNINSLLEFYICGCGILCCSMFGLVGNISTILTLKYRKIKMNQTFTNLIVWLAAIDSLFLVSYIHI